ncbi:alpha-keto acid decarboxylase family protein [Roseibium sp. RKSG952]|uniref:alpha-keto acid decarboxylase family protein n=1 Tax=Roseibium sp. RKSG952 TaxID=2529384 RepID=UPI0012BD1E68|nr:thiamine pyrophosphate-binding protein [Roseibium sp. RKSG952]MTH96016.1 alpha-keto acid decarboxylase family protein [Roseibium sp. RKSG952]
MSVTVLQYVLSRLKSIGVDHVFGVPGDFSFPVNDAIVESEEIEWVGACNELNAAYAADGYARIKGVGAVATTYGVGELSALSGIAGSYAEHVPIFHLVGAPSMSARDNRLPVHHTLGNGEFGLFQRMADPVVAASALMTPQNVVPETERLIRTALYERRPVYMAFPSDYANEPVCCSGELLLPPVSDPHQLKKAVEAIEKSLAKARTAVAIPGFLVSRLGLNLELEELVNHSGLPFVTMFMGKTVLDETHPQYAGMYAGALLDRDVRTFVEGADAVLTIGTLLGDFNTGAFTANLDPGKLITIGHHKVTAGGQVFHSVEIADVVRALAGQLAKRNWPQIGSLYGKAKASPKAAGAGPITAETLYTGLERFFKPGDIIVADAGTISMGLAFTSMPSGASFQAQGLWAAIGWATPAAFGMAVAAPDKRVILATGEGAHQLTAQEISQFGRYGLKPVVIVLNNDGYLIERLLCKDPEAPYNDLAQWRYSELPRVFGCNDWQTAKVSTVEAFQSAISAAGDATVGTYIEVVTDRYVASGFAEKLHDSKQSLYSAA